MMQLGQAAVEFLDGYFATNDRSKKTKVAYRADLEQFAKFAGENAELSA